MTANHPTSQYALGSTEAEHEPLIWQAQSVVPLTEGLFREAGKPELKGLPRQFPVADCSLRITLRNNLALTDIAGQIELHYPACR